MMTKVLLITNKSDITSDFIVKTLQSKDISFYRFNTEELFKSISITLDIKSNTFLLYDNTADCIISLNKFSSVYFRRPEIPEFKFSTLSSGEKEFLRKETIYLLEGIYKITRNSYWVSPIYAIRAAENKVYQLELAKLLGFNIPETLISNSYEECKKFYELYDSYCILKPIKSGLIEEENNSKVIFTSQLINFPTEKDKVESFPLFIQKKIDKKADVRVIVVGSKVFATLIHSQEHFETSTDWRRGGIELKHSEIDLPPKLQNSCVKLLRKLNLKFGAIDFILDKNDNFIFLEINPNGQWAWIENKTDYNISSEIVDLLQYEYF